MTFFNQFPIIDYDVNYTGTTQALVDISRLVDVNDILASDSVSYTKYDVIDGARPDIISQLIYDTPEYYWTFFIVNDHLKDGYKAWPKSEVALNKYIDENYKGVVMVAQPAAGFSFNKFPLNEYLSIYNKDNPEERIYFKGYENSTYSLTFDRIDSSHFEKVISGTQNNISWPEFVNPHNVNTPEYLEVESIRRQWNIELFNFVQTLRPVDIDYYIGQAFASPYDGLVVGSAPYYQRLADYLANEESFSIYDNFYHEKNAPAYFMNASGERVSAYESMSTFITNAENEISLNNSREQIKIIRPERIDEFARRFKELINE